MKILDTRNAGPRLKVFLLWGTLLFIVQFVSGLVFSSLGDSGLMLAIAVSLLFAGFAGYMAANALQNNTGDKRSSAIYGAVIPIFAMILSLVVNFFMGNQVEFNLPLLPILAGLAGGFISQKRF